MRSGHRFLSSCPLSPRRERDPSNTFNTVTQSASVILVSMAGLLEPAPMNHAICDSGIPWVACFPTPFFQRRERDIFKAAQQTDVQHSRSLQWEHLGGTR